MNNTNNIFVKMQLVMLPGKPILVSDEEIKKGEIYWDKALKIMNSYLRMDYPKDGIRIIAGIHELPTIDFSALSEEDCKTIGWIDVDALATIYATNHGMMSYVFPDKKEGFIKGFTTAQSLSDDKFSLDDIQKALSYGYHAAKDELKGIRSSGYGSRFMESLSRPKVFEVEIDSKELCCGLLGGSQKNEPLKEICNFCSARHNYQPKIINNSIKILRVITQVNY